MSSDSSTARAERRRATFGKTVGSMPARIGRFHVEHVLGQGGLGVVYAGRDPELDRLVALKVVRGDALVRHADSRARLVREARTLARLDHPNVVRVFDVGWVDEADPSSPVFIAMELVVGCTLREWLRAAPRTWREICARFLAAGRGLAAVHAAGFVHRDFKPSNVLVADDDRVLLADFGLVQGVAAAPEGALAVADTTSWSGSSSEAHDDPLTRIGTVLGTPHYMAPEQRAGRRVIAASDQYSFCVALADALFGGSSAGANDARRVPHRVRRAVERGRSPRARERFATMDVLIAELERALHAHAGSAVLWALAGACVCIGATVLALSVPVATSCDRDARADALWGPERKAEIEAALVPTLPDDGDAWSRVATELDVKADAWADALAQTCAAERDAALAERVALQHACLQDVHAQIEGVILALERPHAQTWVHALQAARAIEPAARCLADDGAASPDPPMRELVHLSALVGLGHHHEALAEARRLELEHPEDPRVAATAALALGRVALADAAHQDAADHLERAYWVASANDVPWARRLAGEAAIGMLHLSWVRGRFDDAHVWSRHAEVAVARAGADDLEDELALEIAALEKHLGRHEAAEDRVEAVIDRTADRPGSEKQWRRALGMHIELLATRGAYEPALQEAELALAVSRDEYGDEHPVTATAHYHVAMAHDYAGRKEQTLAALRESLRIEEAAFGPAHVHVAQTNAMVGNTLQGLGRADEARGYLEHALAATEQVHGRHHRATGEMVGLLATNAAARGDLAAADALSARELEILGRWLPEDTDEVAIAKGARAEVLFLLGRAQEAEALAKAAIVSARAVAGAEYSSPEIEVLNVLLRIWLQHGQADEALAEATRVLVVIRARGETATRDAAMMLWFQGQAHLQLGAPKDAAAALLAATEAIDRGGIDQPELSAVVQLELARALAKTGPPTSARKAAELAIADFRAMRDGDGVAKAERVLAELP